MYVSGMRNLANTQGLSMLLKFLGVSTAAHKGIPSVVKGIIFHQILMATKTRHMLSGLLCILEKIYISFRCVTLAHLSTDL